jgi:hypothetical protein
LYDKNDVSVYWSCDVWMSVWMKGMNDM